MLENISSFHINTLFILGLALFGGTVGGRLFQKAKIPQVVGYIMIGLILGRSGLNIIDHNMIKALQPLNYFALGLIGFMIGGELKQSVLKKYGRQFITILLFEGLVSFICVTLIIGFIGSIILKDPSLAWGLALLLGAISSATAPAATTDVLWEAKAKGPLTTTVFGIVALDDALALTLFAAASTFATRLLGISHESLLVSLLHPVYEIGGAVLIGLISGRLLMILLKHYDQKERVLVFLVGTVMLVIGLSIAMNISMILAAMVLGTVVVNGVPNLSKRTFDIVQEFSPPIYVLFFVFIGAKLKLDSIDPILIVLVVLYLLGRTSGKMFGATIGARISGASESVCKYLPLCLFSQAGVAIGLSIVAAHLLPEEQGNMIIIIVTASTFAVQLIGPPCVKYAVTKANEAGRNITEEDLIKKAHVDELMDSSYPLIHENTPSKEILDVFSHSPYTQYPVVDSFGKLSGVINIESIKNSLLFEGTLQLLLGIDLKEQFQYQINKNSRLLEAKQYMDRFHLGFLPVVDDQDVIIGCFDRRMYQRFVSTKLLELQNEG
ncbi:MAG: cation:proton antiporter [Candidatus Omnitrophica bacterium]|nr:cation:proton antiporter [Candidatus Omnitrophota bacterium]